MMHTSLHLSFLCLIKKKRFDSRFYYRVQTIGCYYKTTCFLTYLWSLPVYYSDAFSFSEVFTDFCALLLLSFSAGLSTNWHSFITFAFCYNNSVMLYRWDMLVFIALYYNLTANRNRAIKAIWTWRITIQTLNDLKSEVLSVTKTSCVRSRALCNGSSSA
jgi:hypothetical protein